MMHNTFFRPGEVWLDTEGNSIQAHGGGVIVVDGVYYWFGENKNAPNSKNLKLHDGSTMDRVDVIGVSCYSSRDLLNWKHEGIVLPAVPGDPSHDLHPSKVAERPKVIYNAKTKKYVMWLHVDTPDYVLAACGIAVSDTVTGPYHYVGHVRPNGKDSRDFTVYVDDDAHAYLVHSSDWNSVTMIADLTDDYLGLTGHYTRHFDAGATNNGRESAAVFKQDGRYYIITSGTTGWNPNPAEYAVADNMHGPWEVKGNPCVGKDAETTFHSQDTFVLPVPGRPGKYIFMGDRWFPQNLQNSRYVWLPLEVNGDQLTVKWLPEWDLSAFD
ncbi:MAG: glycoside hydrolase family 43 protein [Chthoniobacteraceae bacterium]